MTNPTNNNNKTSQQQPQQNRPSSVKPEANESAKKPYGSQNDKSSDTDKM